AGRRGARAARGAPGAACRPRAGAGRGVGPYLGRAPDAGLFRRAQEALPGPRPRPEARGHPAAGDPTRGLASGPGAAGWRFSPTWEARAADAMVQDPPGSPRPPEAPVPHGHAVPRPGCPEPAAAAAHRPRLARSRLA